MTFCGRLKLTTKKGGRCPPPTPPCFFSNTLAKLVFKIGLQETSANTEVLTCEKRVGEFGKWIKWRQKREGREKITNESVQALTKELEDLSCQFSSLAVNDTHPHNIFMILSFFFPCIRLLLLTKRLSLGDEQVVVVKYLYYIYCILYFQRTVLVIAVSFIYPPPPYPVLFL